jgi:hypothetical protein
MAIGVRTGAQAHWQPLARNLVTGRPGRVEQPGAQIHSWLARSPMSKARLGGVCSRNARADPARCVFWSATKWRGHRDAGPPLVSVAAHGGFARRSLGARCRSALPVYGSLSQRTVCASGGVGCSYAIDRRCSRGEAGRRRRDAETDAQGVVITPRVPTSRTEPTASPISVHNVLW